MTRSIPRAVCALLLAGLILAGCGKVGELTPQTGKALPARAYGQSQEQTATALITPSVQSRPGRSDELLRRSQSRSDDPFDLPPGSTPVPVTDAQAEKTPSRNQPASPQNGSKPQ
jgi:hypothetical protein